MRQAAPIGTAHRIVLDHTDNDDYDRLVTEELGHYNEITITDELTEGGAHANKSWNYYFEYLYSKHFNISFYEAVWKAAGGRVAPRVLSLGCGYGGHDLHIARSLGGSYELLAVDLNPGVYYRALQRARAEGLNIRFEAHDLNRVSLEPGYFDVIYASASIHHIVNLEHLLEQLHRGLKDDGRLVIGDIIGKTQVEFWRENVEYAAKLVKRLPARFRPVVGRRRIWRRWFVDPYTIISPYVEPEIQKGMEGIRQEEIVPLLDRWFRPEKAFYFDAYMRLICTNPFIGHRIDPGKLEDRVVLESLIDEELAVIASGRLRPTEVFGIYEKKAV
jgi:SAM-dependent methyltransferase